jgi:hypothetical protein
MGLGLSRLIQQINAIDADLAMIGGEVAGEHTHGGAFARAIGTEKTYDFTFFDTEADVIDCGRSAKIA